MNTQSTLVRVAIGLPWITDGANRHGRAIGRAGTGIRRTLRYSVRIGLLLTSVCLVVIASDAVIRGRLGGVADQPVRYYARPVVLEAGARVTMATVVGSLERGGYARAAREVHRGQYRIAGQMVEVGRRPYRMYDRVDPGGLTRVRWYGGGAIIRGVSDDRDGNNGRVMLEPELISVISGDVRRDALPVPLSAIPRHVIDAVLVAEDQRFYDHPGVDLRRVIGAARANLAAGRVVQGASTITQQLAKNVFLSPERSWLRKFREIAFAFVLEARYGKDRILEDYLNEIYMGQNGSVAVHGIARAATFYFGKDISELDVSEGALLAGIIKGPGLFSPRTNLERALRRRDLVLRSMRDLDLISESDLDIALTARPVIVPRRSASRRARYFVAHAERETMTSGNQGRAVFTTLEPGLQRLAQTSVTEGLRDLERRYPRLAQQPGPLQAAMVAINHSTGEIVAMVGGRDFGQSQFNRATMGLRQPGSAFKPIVALAALASRTLGEAGDRSLNLASTLQDSPLSLVTPAGLWEPGNYDGSFRGGITIREALEQSLNVPFARLGLEIGPGRISRTAHLLGIESELVEVPSLALGASEVTLLELTRAYGTIANGGVLVSSHEIVGMLDARGRRVPCCGAVRSERVFDPAEAYLVTSALEGVVERGTGHAIRDAGYDGAIAGKSGTTNNYRDAWFVGYTPSITVGVWVGFDDGTSIGLSGSGAALPIFTRFVTAIRGENDARFEIPYGVERIARREGGNTWFGGRCGEAEYYMTETAPDDACLRRPSFRTRTPRNRWKRFSGRAAGL